jgi:hypothetical protein
MWRIEPLLGNDLETNNETAPTTTGTTTEQLFFMLARAKGL